MDPPLPDLPTSIIYTEYTFRAWCQSEVIDFLTQINDREALRFFQFEKIEPPFPEVKVTFISGWCLEDLRDVIMKKIPNSHGAMKMIETLNYQLYS